MNQFTPRAQQILASARREADRLQQNYVGTEHLLLGLVKLGQGNGVTVLQKFGLDLETIRLEVEKQLGSGPHERAEGNIPYTPRVKKVLALAGKEAKMLGHTWVGTEHILLGLLHEGEGVAARVLKTMGLDMEDARAKVAEEIRPDPSRQAAIPLAPNPTQEPRPQGRPSAWPGIPLAASAAAGNFFRLEEEFKRTREEIFRKFESVLAALEAVKSDLTGLRIDVLKGNS